MQKVRFKMANNSKSKVEVQKETTQEETVTKTVKAAVKEEPTYTVSEFASAPETVEANADIIVAALTIDGKESYTVTEAKEIINKFKSKEVK